MEAKYTIRQYEKAKEDLEEVYQLAEDKLKIGCMPVSREAMINAFQVFRYAFQDWAKGQEVGVVLRALMYRELRSREVSRYIPRPDMSVICDDDSMAEALERELRRNGYEEECNEEGI